MKDHYEITTITDAPIQYDWCHFKIMLPYFSRTPPAALTENNTKENHKGLRWWTIVENVVQCVTNFQRTERVLGETAVIFLHNVLVLNLCSHRMMVSHGENSRSTMGCLRHATLPYNKVWIWLTTVLSCHESLVWTRLYTMLDALFKLAIQSSLNKKRKSKWTLYSWRHLNSCGEPESPNMLDFLGLHLGCVRFICFINIACFPFFVNNTC